MDSQKKIYLLGETAHASLNLLLTELRDTVKKGYLHIFEHTFDNAALRMEELEANRALLKRAQKELRAFRDQAYADEKWQECYVNIHFTLNSIDIMTTRLESLELSGDINKVITSIENINNNLHVILDEMLTKCHYV